MPETSAIEQISNKLEAFSAARKNGQIERARTLSQEAVAEARKQGSSELLVHALRAHGQIERDAGAPQRALPPYIEAAEILSDCGTATAYAHSLRHLGELYMELSQLDKADAALTTAVEIYSANLDAVTDLEHANAIRPYAVLQHLTGKRLAAQASWLKARELYEAAGVLEGVNECDAQLAALASEP